MKSQPLVIVSQICDATAVHHGDRVTVENCHYCFGVLNRRLFKQEALNMAFVRTKIVNGKEYKSLEERYRENGKVKAAIFVR